MEIHIHVHHHNHGDEETKEKLNLIIQQNTKIMADLEVHEAALGRIEAATTKLGNGLLTVADRIKALEDKIKNSGLTKEQEEGLLAKTTGLAANLETQADALIQMGQTPENPVPVEPTEPPAEGETTA